MRFLMYFIFQTLCVMVLVFSAECRCDSRFIRTLYVISCGKKKREISQQLLDVEHEPLPNDLEGLKLYIEQKHPHLLSDSRVQRIWSEPEHNMIKKKVHDIHKIRKKSISRFDRKTTRLDDTEKSTISGIPGFPASWDIKELMGGRTKMDQRRSIEAIIYKCCKNLMCTEADIIGAC